jgi:hypothetical protein
MEVYTIIQRLLIMVVNILDLLVQVVMLLVMVAPVNSRMNELLIHHIGVTRYWLRSSYDAQKEQYRYCNAQAMVKLLRGPLNASYALRDL